MARRESFADLLGNGQPSVAATTNDMPAAVLLPVARCAPNPHNPRLDLGDLSDLADIVNIQLQSVLAITRGAYLKLWPEDAETVRGIDHIIVNGCRRHAASVKYGRADLIAVVNDDVASSRARLLRAALDENDQRRDFDPIEQANAVKAIVDEYPSQAEACRAEGWDKTWASQRVRLLLLAPEVQQSIRSRAAGGQGMAIRDARWLSGRSNITELTAEQQFAAVEAMRGEEQAKRETAKASERGKAHRKPKPAETAPKPSETEEPYTAVYERGATSEGLPSSAEGESATATIPDQRETASSTVATEGLLHTVEQLRGAAPEQIAQVLVDQVPAEELMKVIDLVIAQLRKAGVS